MSLCVMILFFLAASFVSAVSLNAANKVVVAADAKLMRRDPDPIEDATIEDTESQESNADNSKAVQKKEPVSISLYYESRCPDCIEFINKTLEPLWRSSDLRSHIKITMNPYGNSMSVPVGNISEGYKFFHPDTTGEGWDYVHICQHGADECLGNLIQACAMDQVEQDKYMELVFCMASHPSWGIEKSSYECMASAGIDHKPVKECVESPHGNTLMAKFGEQTQAVPNRSGTPWVMMGGVNIKDVKQLMRNACHKLSNILAETEQPASCLKFKGAAGDDEPEQQTEADFPILIKESAKEDVQNALSIPESV